MKLLDAGQLLSADLELTLEHFAISKSDSHFDFSVRVESGKRKWEVETSGSRKKLNGPRGDA
jgi:hypothetical protein